MEVIDATDQVLGRLCSQIASKLLDGQEVTVINAEKAIITGKPDNVYEKYREKIERGDPHHGPEYPTLPDKILVRTVRGMLPYKKERGKEALKRLQVHSGNPDDREGERIAKDSSDLLHKHVTLEDVSRKLRGE